MANRRRGNRGKKSTKVRDELGSIEYDDSGSLIPPHQPHEYRASLDKSLKRIVDLRNQRSLMMSYGPWLVGWLLVAAAWVFLIGIGSPKSAFEITALGTIALAGYGAFLTWSGRFKTQTMRCPHLCETEIDMQWSWECGHCGNQETISTLAMRQFTSLFGDGYWEYASMPCNHCREKPHSLLCPSCDNEIIVDEAAWRDAPKDGAGKSGTTRGLEPAERTHPILKQFVDNAVGALALTGLACCVIVLFW